jgi:signal transduction histidine kinase
MRLRAGTAFFPKRIQNPVVRYAIAFVSVLSALALSLAFFRLLGSGQLPLFFAAIAVAAWYGGRGPGLLASALAIVSIDFVLKYPHMAGPGDFFVYARLFAFVLFSFMMAALRDAGEAYKTEQERLLAREREARADAEEAARHHSLLEDRLTVLVEASGALLTSMPSSEMAESVVNLCRGFVAADAYAVWRYFESSDQWLMISASNLSDRYRENFFAGMRDVNLEIKGPVTIPNVQTDPRLAARTALYRDENIQAILIIPLQLHGQNRGAISFYYHEPHEFAEAEVRVATALGNLAGAALVNAELFQEQSRLRAEAQSMTSALQSSNEELQRFAYVASHDLQEPLRMVGSYATLLAKNYRGKLDADADEFLGYISGGVQRMQALVRDLLAYSRAAESPQQNTEYISLKAVLSNVLLNLRHAIEDSGATVTHDELPSILGDATQFTQLLQNLIGNAIKYHGADPPAIHIGCERAEGQWIFSVRDNGIGIEQRHFDRIFGIFKRLHSHEEYPGTGIGLAIARRIVERYGGRIWVESQLGAGATFFFSVPGEIVEAESV